MVLPRSVIMISWFSSSSSSNSRVTSTHAPSPSKRLTTRAFLSTSASKSDSIHSSVSSSGAEVICSAATRACGTASCIARRPTNADGRASPSAPSVKHVRTKARSILYSPTSLLTVTPMALP